MPTFPAAVVVLSVESYKACGSEGYPTYATHLTRSAIQFCKTADAKERAVDAQEPAAVQGAELDRTDSISKDEAVPPDTVRNAAISIGEEEKGPMPASLQRYPSPLGRNSFSLKICRTFSVLVARLIPGCICFGSFAGS